MKLYVVHLVNDFTDRLLAEVLNHSTDHIYIACQETQTCNRDRSRHRQSSKDVSTHIHTMVGRQNTMHRSLQGQ